MRRRWQPLVRSLPSLAWEALQLELALYRSLARWIVRRPAVPPGATPISYAQLVGPMLWLWIFGSATEVVVVEVVLREIEAGWTEALRLPLLVIGVWGVLWMLGMLAAYRVRPHLLSGDTLLIRNSARTWVQVPLDAVATTAVTEHELPSTIRAVHHADGALLVGVSGRTNLELALIHPTLLPTSKGEVTVGRVGLWVDEPRVVAKELSTRISAHP